MDVALLVGRLVLAAVFVLAGAAKLADLAGSRRAVRDFGMPAALSGPAGTLLPLAELAVGVALVPVASARFGAIGAAVLLTAFTAAIARALTQGRAPECHCFGQVHSEPAGPRTLARNVALLAVAGFVAIGGWSDGGTSATAWATRVGAGWLVAIGACVLLLGMIGFTVWFCLALLAQNGRTLDRLAAIEGALAQAGTVIGAAADVAEADLPGGGLAVGVPAPDFALEDLNGKRHTLRSLIAPAGQLLLVFSDAGCGACDALMPELAGWQQRLELVVVSSGDHDRNRAKAAEHGIERMLLQSGREVSEAFEAHGTPMAVVIDADGRIASRTVGGEDAIRALAQRAGRPLLEVRRPSPPEPSRVGEPAPALVLHDLEGGRVALSDLYAERTLAIFWNPSCGFCAGMLDDLRSFERDRPQDGPAIVLIARDRDRMREHDLRSRVLIDDAGEAMTAFDAHGTPMAVLIEQGRIASPVAAGASAVFELAGSAS